MRIKHLFYTCVLACVGMCEVHRQSAQNSTQVHSKHSKSKGASFTININILLLSLCSHLHLLPPLRGETILIHGPETEEGRRCKRVDETIGCNEAGAQVLQLNLHRRFQKHILRCRHQKEIKAPVSRSLGRIRLFRHLQRNTFSRAAEREGKCGPGAYGNTVNV